MNLVLNSFKKAFSMTIVLLLLCGLVYPLLLTGISQLIFPHQANGSLITVNDKIVGSKIIGQDFKDTRFMKCRPSAVNYNTYTEGAKSDGSYTGVASGSNNYAPSNPKLAERVSKDIEAFMKANPTIEKSDIPTDLLTASGSGLDPHISPAAAAIQIPALSEATGLSQAELEAIVKENTNTKLLEIFGENTVNVLQVNLEIAKAIGLLK